MERASRLRQLLRGIRLLIGKIRVLPFETISSKARNQWFYNWKQKFFHCVTNSFELRNY